MEMNISIYRAFDAINKSFGYTCMLWFSSAKKDIKHDRPFIRAGGCVCIRAGGCVGVFLCQCNKYDGSYSNYIILRDIVATYSHNLVYSCLRVFAFTGLDSRNCFGPFYTESGVCF